MQLKLVYSLIILLLFSAFTPTQQNPTVFMIGDSTMADRNTNNENQERGWGQMLYCIYNHRTTKTNQKYPSVNL